MVKWEAQSNRFFISLAWWALNNGQNIEMNCSLSSMCLFRQNFQAAYCDLLLHLGESSSPFPTFFRPFVSHLSLLPLFLLFLAYWTSWLFLACLNNLCDPACWIHTRWNISLSPIFGLFPMAELKNWQKRNHTIITTANSYPTSIASHCQMVLPCF